MSETSLERLSYRVKLKITNQSPMLKDGMSASAVFEIEPEDKTQIYIPINSIIKEGNNDIVYTIINRKDGIGEIKKTIITTGELNNDKINVSSGLNSGDYLVTRGVGEVQEGQKVKY